MSGPGSRRKFDPVRGSRPSLQFLQPDQLEIDPDYLGANDWKGDEEWAWCAQCDCRRTKDQVLNCDSPFCKIKAARHGQG